MDQVTEITPAEAAEQLGRSHNYVLKLLDSGELAGRRIGPASRGGRWLVDAADVARLKAEWEHNPPRRGRPAATEPSAAALAKRRSRARASESVEVP